MLNIICWALIVVFGLLYTICFIIPIATVKNESKNSYLLLLCLFYTFICIFPIKELYSPLVASRIWQISFSAVLCASILLIFLSREDRYNAIITTIICGCFTILPFYNTINFSTEITPIDVAAERIEVRIDYLASIIGICVSIILILCTFVVMKRTRKIGVDYQLMDLLRQNIKLQASQESFHKPMETLWSYEANSKLRRLDINIKQCITEIQQLSQKPFLPSNVYSASIDELRPMIYKMSVDIDKLKNLVSQKDYTQSLPSDFTILSELNHSLATPLSQIEANCELLKAKVKGGSQSQIDRIIQYVNFCRRTIVAYKELLSSSTSGDSSNYSNALLESFDMYCAKYHKDGVKLQLNATENINISKNILMSIISPLIENAVAATPHGESISLAVECIDGKVQITIENACIKTPNLSDLHKVGFSSKEGHIGTGLETVRHFLNLLDGDELAISIDNNLIKFALQFPLK